MLPDGLSSQVPLSRSLADLTRRRILADWFVWLGLAGAPPGILECSSKAREAPEELEGLAERLYFSQRYRIHRGIA